MHKLHAFKHSYIRINEQRVSVCCLTTKSLDTRNLYAVSCLTLYCYSRTASSLGFMQHSCLCTTSSSHDVVVCALLYSCNTCFYTPPLPKTHVASCAITPYTITFNAQHPTLTPCSSKCYFNALRQLYRLYGWFLSVSYFARDICRCLRHRIFFSF